MDNYPCWCCHECAVEALGHEPPPGCLATWHNGVCDVCERHTAVTEPRDYGWPDFKHMTLKKREADRKRKDV